MFVLSERVEFKIPLQYFFHGFLNIFWLKELRECSFTQFGKCFLKFQISAVSFLLEVSLQHLVMFITEEKEKIHKK